MRKKLTDLSEGDIGPPTQLEATEPILEEEPAPANPETSITAPFLSKDDPGAQLMNIMAPNSGPPIVRPEDDRVLFYITGSPVLASECAEFGRRFVGLLAFMTKITGIDNSPEPEGKKPNYLRVTCKKCQSIIVTIAPQMERFCSQCGAILPSPERFAPAPRAVPMTATDRENAVDADFVAIKGDT